MKENHHQTHKHAKKNRVASSEGVKIRFQLDPVLLVTARIRNESRTAAAIKEAEAAAAKGEQLKEAEEEQTGEMQNTEHKEKDVLEGAFKVFWVDFNGNERYQDTIYANVSEPHGK